MLLRLSKDPGSRDLELLLALARERGYDARFLDGAKRLVELKPRSGKGQPGDRAVFEDRAVVEAVIDDSDAPSLTSRDRRSEDTVVRIGATEIGGRSVGIIAGPCSVEDEPRLLEIARRVRAAGATVLRGGAFKPRTSPYSFQGLGDAGLDALARAKAETGLAVVTEVLDPRDVERVGAVADMLQIGSRSMSNATLLIEAGRSGLPVLLKRGIAATVREFLCAAEYVLAQDNDQVVLCERGIRGFDVVTRNVLDVGTVAHLKRATHLPVIVDPSHAAGRRDLVLPLARAGLAAGADGVIVEVHPEPAETRSDGAQAIPYRTLDDVVAAARALAALDGRRLAAAGGDAAALALAGGGGAR